jgi:hypothetical protein
MMESYRRMGMELPKVFYTDNVDGDRFFLEGIILSLLQNVEPAVESTKQLIEKNNQFANYNAISLPENLLVPVLVSANEIDHSCEEIINKQVGNEVIYVGFDCEWLTLKGPSYSVATRYNLVPKGVASVQISYESVVYLLRVHKFTRDTFPKKLSELLQNDKICKIGKNIRGDMTRLKNEFGVNGNGDINFGSYCRDKDVIEESWRGLDYLCGVILKHRLPKPNGIRCGDWEREELLEEQKYYAALDAWVSVMNSIITKGSPELKNSLCKAVKDKIGEVKQSSSISNRERI